MANCGIRITSGNNMSGELTGIDSRQDINRFGKRCALGSVMHRTGQTTGIQRCA